VTKAVTWGVAKAVTCAAAPVEQLACRQGKLEQIAVVWPWPSVCSLNAYGNSLFRRISSLFRRKFSLFDRVGMLGFRQGGPRDTDGVCALQPGHRRGRRYRRGRESADRGVAVTRATMTRAGDLVAEQILRAVANVLHVGPTREDTRAGPVTVTGDRGIETQRGKGQAAVRIIARAESLRSDGARGQHEQGEQHDQTHGETSSPYPYLTNGVRPAPVHITIARLVQRGKSRSGELALVRWQEPFDHDGWALLCERRRYALQQFADA
jgi:hypothetical protein